MHLMSRKSGTEEMVKVILKKDSENKAEDVDSIIDVQNDSGSTALFLAVLYGCPLNLCTVE